MSAETSLSAVTGQTGVAWCDWKEAEDMSWVIEILYKQFFFNLLIRERERDIDFLFHLLIRHLLLLVSALTGDRTHNFGTSG